MGFPWDLGFGTRDFPRSDLELAVEQLKRSVQEWLVRHDITFYTGDEFRLAFGALLHAARADEPTDPQAAYRDYLDELSQGLSRGPQPSLLTGRRGGDRGTSR